MPEIILTEEQLSVITSSQGKLGIRTPQGFHIGTLDADDSNAVIRHCLNREKGIIPTGIPSEVVMEVLRRMTAENERVGHLDETTARRLWKQYRDEALEVLTPDIRTVSP
jgi:hypothetical protein